MLKQFLDWLEKASPRIGGTVLLASVSAIWLLHTEILPKEIKKVIQPYEAWIWLAFLLSLSLLIGYAVEAAWRAIIAHRTRKSAIKKRIGRFHSFTVEERHALQPFFEEKARTRGGHPEDKVIASLVGERILIQVAQFGFRISEDAWEYLQKNPSLVATPKNPRPPLTGSEWMAH